MLRIGVDGRVLVDRYHGIGRVTFELLDQLAGSGEFHFVIFRDPREPADRFDVAGLGARADVELVDFPVALPSVPQFARWPLLLRRHPVDAMIFPYQLGVTLVGGGRKIVVVHDCIFERDASYAPSPSVLRQHRLLTRLLLRRADVVVPSRATATDLHRYYGVDVPDANVVAWGVSPGFVGERAPAALAAPYLLHVGARRPHKNVPFLVELLAQLPEPMQLVLVGSADHRWRDDTMKVAKQLGVEHRVHERHDVSDRELAALYEHAQAFVYPSAIEGFGLPLLEAMAAGAPVIASDIPVFREIGAAAAEYAPLEVPAWVEAVSRVDEPGHRARLIERGHALAAAATWQRAAAALASVLRDTSVRK